MSTGIHDVVVWISNKRGAARLFTITARKANGNSARLLEVESQVGDAGFIEDYRESGLSKSKAEARKKELKAQYRKRGFTYQTRRALPQAMLG